MVRLLTLAPAETIVGEAGGRCGDCRCLRRSRLSIRRFTAVIVDNDQFARLVRWELALVILIKVSDDVFGKCFYPL